MYKYWNVWLSYSACKMVICNFNISFASNHSNQKSSFYWKWQIINLGLRGFCFSIRTAKKNIDVLISKRQKPLGTRLANNLYRTPWYLLLNYLQYFRPCQVLWIPKVQHFSQRLNHRLVNHLNVAVISARWGGFLLCMQLNRVVTLRWD